VTTDRLDEWMSKNATSRERGNWRRLQGVPLEKLTVEERAALDDVATEEVVPVVVAPPGDPMPNARAFVREHYEHAIHDRLAHHGGQFKTWDGTCWPEVDDRALRAAMYRHFDGATYLDAKEEKKPFQPTMRKVADLIDALRAVVHLSTSVTAPAWLGKRPALGPQPPADEIVSCQNGLLHVPTRTLYTHTPRFFVHHSVPFAFDPDAPAPTRWLAFLDELWPDDGECKRTLREIFGYMVAGDTRQQKIFGLVGPRRSGKGTIARVLTGLVGRHNVAGPTISGLAQNFGLQELIGKPVAIVSDARLRSDQAILTERLLSISGEDTLTIDRKYKDPWTGRLPTRFLLLTNELPRLNDSSGALASRFILLQFTRSFYGKENTALTDELLEELPGILNWSLDGFEHLLTRGRFVQPTSAAEALRELEDLGSPISAFVRDRCTVGPHEVAVDALFDEWKAWCTDNGRDRPGNRQVFGRDLRAAVPGLRTRRPRDGFERARHYIGIGLGGDHNG
jgi:putative DNA primase/helicase